MGRNVGWKVIGAVVVFTLAGTSLPAAAQPPAGPLPCAGAYVQGKGTSFGVCPAAAAAPAAPAVSLYRRLGGREGIAVVVGDFVANMVADNRVNARFKGMKPPDVEKLKSNLADQICDATGGPCSYLGRDMKATH